MPYSEKQIAEWADDVCSHMAAVEVGEAEGVLVSHARTLAAAVREETLQEAMTAICARCTRGEPIENEYPYGEVHKLNGERFVCPATSIRALKAHKPCPVSDKPTVEQLEELSAKATSGDWERDCQSHYDSSERQHYIEHYLTGHLRDRVCTANHGDAQEIRHDDDGIYQDERARTDLEFIAALVNYWRNGGSQVARDGERDKARLDWLDTHPFTMYRERDPGTGTMHHVCLVDENKKPRTGIVNIKVRTAIDAAMSQQEKRDA